ncbi:Sip1-related alpha-galactosidase [Tardisphaera miroshnichenkoae]
MISSKRIVKLSVNFEDGSSCEKEAAAGTFDLCGFGLGELKLKEDGGALSIGVSIKATKTLSEYPVIMSLKGSKPRRALSLTFLDLASPFEGKAFGYYNFVAQGKQPKSGPPPESPDYPSTMQVKGKFELDAVGCWSYPAVLSDYGKLYPYTVMVLAEAEDGSYEAYFAFSSGDLISWFDKDLKLVTYAGKPSRDLRLSYVASLSSASSPYDALRSAVSAASGLAAFNLRGEKRRPRFMEGLGWNSWNALLPEDLSHEAVVNIVKGLMQRGVPLRWITIDDGWEETKEGKVDDVEPSRAKFPNGFSSTVQEVKGLGVADVGLWLATNTYWSGASKRFIDMLGASGFETNKGYVPEPALEGAFKLYDAWLKEIKERGFSFVKVDNQWVVHHLYRGSASTAEASSAVELGLQLASATNCLDVLNCMSMLPGNYSNYAISNAMRVSLDYIPMWKGDAKLHAMWSAYNALLYEKFGYPDYDMWMTYDPFARLIAVSRVFSGGPIYITDRDPDKTDVDLIKWITLDDGELVRVDEPGLITRDIVFRDPYNEPVLLKLASTVNGFPAIAFMNVNKEGARIDEEFKLSDMPLSLKGKYAYYEVLSGMWGTVDASESLRVGLDELESEVVVLAPLVDGKAVIGMVDKVLPPYPARITRAGDELVVETRQGGTLAYLKDGKLEKKEVQKGRVKL